MNVTKQYAMAIIGGKRTPVEVMETLVRVIPIDGHLGDGRGDPVMIKQNDIICFSCDAAHAERLAGLEPDDAPASALIKPEVLKVAKRGG